MKTIDRFEVREMKSSVRELLARWLLVAAIVPGMLVVTLSARGQEVPAEEPVAEVTEEAGDDSDRAAAVDVEAEDGVHVEAMAVELPGFAFFGPALTPDQRVQMREPYLAQLRPLLTAELHFMRSVCQPNKDQYARLKKDSHVALIAAADQIVEQQFQFQNGIRDAKAAQPNETLASRLRTMVAEQLSSEQSQRYNAELEKRAAHRKRVVILNIVANMDQELLLSVEQREQIEKLLETHWDDEWGEDLRYYTAGFDFMPPLPDNELRKVLNARQQRVWESTPRHGNVVFGVEDFGGIQVIEIEEEELPDE